MRPFTRPFTRLPASKLLLLLALSGTFSSACLSSGALPEKDVNDSLTPSSSGEAAPLADIVSFEQTEAGVSVQVVTTGCTRADDFQPSVRAIDTGRAQLTIRRLKPDDCRRMPALKRVSFSRERLGLGNEEIILMIPLVALPGRG